MVWILGYNSKSLLVWLSLLLLKHPVIFTRKEYLKQNEIIYSSVWCSSSIFSKICSFSNLCYDPNFNNFLFILGKDSIISGFTSRKQLQEISTTWFNHSQFYLKLVLVDNVSNYMLISDKTVIMSRFKPDNIMHLIHDDLLPLYVMYKRICFGNIKRCFSDTLIAFADKYSYFNNLYNAFSKRPHIILHSLDSLICFSEAYVGLDSDSIFFQYGFEKPQGAVKPFVSGELIYEFSEYILNYLKIDRIVLSKCTFISRKLNRKILNEKYLEELVSDLHLRKTNSSISVINLDINSNSVEDVIRSVATSKLLFGMHGAGMILAMFLPLNSIILELFPYGIVKEHVSAVYSMSKISGIHFKYFFWVNQHKENSLSHPEYPQLLGGFESITEVEKLRISKATTVPAVFCCHDPLYLHFMYQDTYVDYSIVNVILDAYDNHELSNVVSVKKWYFPSHVQNINCSVNHTHVMLSWDPPFNVKYLTKSLYKVTMSCSKFNNTSIIENSFLVIETSIPDKFFSIWVQCLVNEIEGAESHFVCNLSDQHLA